jgi:hypothetical protein
MGYFFGLVCSCQTGGGGGGTKLASVTVAAGATNNLNPGGTWPTGYSRLDVDPSAGAANLTGLLAGTDAQQIVIRNPDATNTLTLNNANAGSTAANQFLARAGFDVAIPPGSSVIATYYGGSIDKWVITT